MAFDIQHWEEALKQKLPKFRERMKRAGVNLEKTLPTAFLQVNMIEDGVVIGDLNS